jgi:N-acyl homoserine lactone hydrolase
VAVPQATPPEEMTVHALPTGTMSGRAAFSYRGGSLEARTFGADSVLVRHPQGLLLIDAGLGSRAAEHVRAMPALMRMLSRMTPGAPAAQQLRAAGIDPGTLAGVILTHAHWDHVSGLSDLPGVPVWVPQAERDFIAGGHRMAQVAAGLGALDYRVYRFGSGPYLGFEASHDVFGDGAVVVVPAPGHTPGSVIVFVTAPGEKRYAFVGDLVWQREGIEIPAQKPRLSRRMVDADPEQVRRWIVHMHQLQKAVPGLIVVPAHDRRVHDQLPRLAS